MTITSDTNVLARFLIRDHPAQALLADQVISDATLIIVPIATLCELLWVLRTSYRLGRTEMISVIEVLLRMEKLKLDRDAVKAGLAMLQAGGDFSDGVIAHEGRTLGNATFVSFDRKAVALLRAQGYTATDPANFHFT